MGWGEYARSKVPLKLVFILMAAVLVNSLIVEVFRLMYLYDYKDPIDLSLMNESYKNAVILDTARDDDATIPLWEGKCTAYLLETEDGELKFAIVEKHFLLDRYRYLEKFSADVPRQEGRQSVQTGTLHHQAGCWIVDNAHIEYFNMGQNYGPKTQLLLIPMIIVEYLAYCYLFKREELM